LVLDLSYKLVNECAYVTVLLTGASLLTGLDYWNGLPD